MDDRVLLFAGGAGTGGSGAAGGLVSARYAAHAAAARRARTGRTLDLLAHRRIPAAPTPDAELDALLLDLAALDSNNVRARAAVGEREGRVHSALVARRHYYLAHGVGRSGDLNAEQPKAVGSSILVRAAAFLAADAVRIAGVRGARACVLVPAATGMTLTLAMLALRDERPHATHVVWPRVDQRTCVKCIAAAGLTPAPVANVLEGDEVATDVAGVARTLDALGADRVLCVLTTLSVFTPRAPDRVVEVARLCAARGVPHLVNNAYGLQSSKCTHLLSEAIRLGRVDAAVSSTDKNFMVPVGGALLYSPRRAFADTFAARYPGRASASPALDLFMTLLGMGADGLRRALADRRELFEHARERLRAVAERHGERALQTRSNNISLALTLARWTATSGRPAGELGSMLFTRMVFGARAVSGTARATVAGVEFVGFGAHTDAYPVPYVTFSATIGGTRADLDLFFERLEECLGAADKLGARGVPRPPSAPQEAEKAEEAEEAEEEEEEKKARKNTAGGDGSAEEAPT